MKDETTNSYELTLTPNKEEKDKRIKTLTEIPCANVMTLKDKFNRWYDVYAEDIRDEARMEIRNLIDELE